MEQQLQEEHAPATTEISSVVPLKVGTKRTVSPNFVEEELRNSTHNDDDDSEKVDDNIEVKHPNAPNFINLGKVAPIPPVGPSNRPQKLTEEEMQRKALPLDFKGLDLDRKDVSILREAQ